MLEPEPPKVLIVDDQPRNLDALEVMLGHSDCTLVRASSADEALLCLLRDDFAAIVLDIRMPDMSGIELAKLIKQRKRSQHLPILFLTAHLLDNDDVLRGYGVGAVDYLTKPLNPEILRSKIGVFVDLFRKTRALTNLNERLHQEIVERENAQLLLKSVNQELERRVDERTGALAQALKSAGEARDEAERQGRLKDEFLATLSHELRTPMNVILGWLDILSSGQPIRDFQSTIALIQRNARLQAKLIDDLLDMNRLLAGSLVLDVASIDVAATLYATIKSLQPVSTAKSIQLVARVPRSPVHAVADSRRIQQVLWNLLHNAIKFTPEGGRIEARIEQLGHELSITIQDTGCGISAAFLPFVFERFRQEDSSTTRESSGLGLGLSISKHLVEMHGGSITADSPGAGRGSTFVVRLPTAAAAASRDTDAASEQRSESAAAYPATVAKEVEQL